MDGYENWTRARKTVDHLINLNPLANMRAYCLSVKLKVVRYDTP